MWLAAMLCNLYFGGAAVGPRKGLEVVVTDGVRKSSGADALSVNGSKLMVQRRPGQPGELSAGV